MKIREFNWVTFENPLLQVIEKSDYERHGFRAKFNAKHFVPAWGRMMQHGTAVAFGAYDGGTPVGWIGGFIVPDILTGEMNGIEYLWVRVPGHDGRELLKAFEKKAWNAGCRVVVCGALTCDRSAGMRRLYRRLGYVPHGEDFRKELEA
jgi:hypothetical protein